MERLKKFTGEMNAASFLDEQERPGSGLSVASRMSRNGTLNGSMFSQAALSQRIVNVEHYMTAPVKEFDNLYSEFRNSAVKKVPVVRIFGSTPAGQKVCANIHGVYPYVSILDDDTVDGLEYRIAAALDNAINDSVNTNKFRKGDQSHKKAATQHVFKVIRVIGKTFYGYQTCNEVFLRIFFYNPLMLRKAVDLLQSGSILSRRFQPYEAHIPYTLQFMIDYCLYGMNYIHYSAVKFRRNALENIALKFSEEIDSISQTSVPGYIDPNNIDESRLGPKQLSKLTLCELELDVLASDIILDSKVSEKAVSVNPGIDSIWKDEIERRRMHGVEECSQITIPESQERSQAPARFSAEERYIDTLLRKLESVSTANLYDNSNETSQSQTRRSQNSTFLNSSLVDDADILPSSQVLNHLSETALSQNQSVLNNQLSQDQDEFIKLLEEMIEENVPECVRHEIEEDPFGNELTDEEGKDKVSNQPLDIDENDEENVWDDSFLNTSVLQGISDSETDNQDSVVCEKRNSPDSSITIFQCDGHGGDSDSNSDDNSQIGNLKSEKVERTTRSKRKSEIKPNGMDSSSTSGSRSNKVERHHTVSSGHKNSPSHANRLSLTLRRKSRSQEVAKIKSQGSADSGTSREKLVQRRSRSVSTEKTEKRRIEKGKSIKPDAKNHETLPAPTTSSVSGPVTRKSLSVEQPPVKKAKRSRTAKGSQQSTTTDKASESLSKATKSKIQIDSSKIKILDNKVARVCLTKIDSDPQTISLSSKRARRKPQRFLDNEEKSPSTEVKEASSNGESENEKTLAEEQLSTALPEPGPNSHKQRKGRPDTAKVSEQVSNVQPITIGNDEKVTKKKRRKNKTAKGPESSDINSKQPVREVEVASAEEPPKKSNKKLGGRKKDLDNNKRVADRRQQENAESIVDVLNDNHNMTAIQPVQSSSESVVETIGEGNDETNAASSLKGLEAVVSDEEIVSKELSDAPKFTKSTRKRRKLSENEKNKLDLKTNSCDKEEIPLEDNNGKTSQGINSEVPQNSHESSLGLRNGDIIQSDPKKDSRNDKKLAIPEDGSHQSSGKQSFDHANNLITISSPACDVQSLKKKKRRPGFGMSKIIKTTVNSHDPCPSKTEEKKECDESTATVSVSNSSVPVTKMEATNNLPLCEEKQYADIGTTCKPDNESVLSQTEAEIIESKDVGISARPSTTETATQLRVTSTNSETQTSSGIMVSVEIQTETVVPMCMCQCTCVTKEKSDATVDTQDDLKPVMESKKIQVDNVQMIPLARTARFSTPQSNKIKLATPSKSPEKRKTLGESPQRRPVTSTMSHSRYLSALAKTPTSHHKYRTLGRSNPSTPKDTASSPQVDNNSTPPSRESREGYLISSIRAASSSPRKRAGLIRPRNLDAETRKLSSVFSDGAAGSPVLETTPANASMDEEASIPSEIADEKLVTIQSPESPDGVDLSVNSIYEYEESSPKVEFSSAEEGEEGSPATCLSNFQRKRIQSRHRSKNRQEKRRAAYLDANRGIPDIFEVEYEPLKQPASYKSTMKWLEAGNNRLCGKPSDHEESAVKVEVNGGDSSDEECLPPPVKLFGGGNMSDDDNSDDENSNSGRILERRKETIRPFTPPLVNLSISGIQASPPESSIHCNETPRSILRQRGSSRRSVVRVLKRKIRWEDEEPCKRLKLEWDNVVVKEEIDEGSQSSITNGTMNKTIDTSELDGPSFKNALGLENSMSNLHDVKAFHQCQFLTTMYVEIHCSSRNDLLPDPAQDPVLSIFILISNDYPDGFRKPKECLHLLVLDDKATAVTSTENELGQSIKACSSEGDLIDAFIALVHQWDPDILVGYEIEKSSLGYLIQRGQCFGKDILQDLSRVVPAVTKEGANNFAFRQKEEWNGTIGGRIVLNLWRLLRHEITVQSYTFENAAYHILLRRVCKFSQKTLRDYWSHKMHRYKVIQYYIIRVRGAMQILEKLDLINRTSELARLFGIQFYEVLSRGSQFRVESMMLRATKPLDLIAPSPTVLQRAKMRAPEYLPLILEPRSNYYTDPVAVLDFQSLYPSMMIAYNYDYASLLGRVEHLGGFERFPIGCLDHAVSPGDLLRLKDNIHVSPAGVAFVDKSVIKGVLPEMLEQILDTRQMVKRAMKKWKNEGASLHKVLDSRQLGLKLIANVTYGYTSANFSGRMPCVEIADSIVSKGRETLQRAIDHVKENYARWGAEVVYGDTDSMFVLFRGKSREQAFKLAYEIADEVTQANPKPVKLKFEKIYQPCILQSKKRYVGYSYETPDQVKPTYDAKGIETVRRDGCPAVKKILEKTLHVLFTSNKREKVQQYVKSQFEKLFKGRVSMQDYIFAREYRGRMGYKPKACVPSLEIAKRLVQKDPRAEPLVSERVPYVVVYGNPTLPLIKLVRTPQEYLENSGLRLNAHYYIEKAIIPALNRCLMHAGINPMQWYLELPRKFLRNVLDQKTRGQGTLDDYILHQNCLRCEDKAEQGLCNNCLSDETGSIVYLQEVLRNAKSKLNSCVEICMNCAGETDRCVSIDCPVLHKLIRYQRDQAHMKKLENELVKLEW